MPVQSARVPILDPVTGKFPDSYAPPSVAVDAAAAASAASAAAGSAGLSAESAGAASTSAGTATTKAGEAAQAAADAALDATAAQTARTGAEAAQAGAEAINATRSVTLAGSYTVDTTGWQPSQTVTLVMTQDATGGRLVSHAGGFVPITSTAGASTTTVWTWDGTAWNWSIVGARPTPTPKRLMPPASLWRVLPAGQGTIGAAADPTSTISDAADVHIGSASVRLTTKGDGGFCTYQLALDTPHDFSGHTLRIHIKLDDYAPTNFGVFYAATDGNFDNRFSVQWTESAVPDSERTVRAGRWATVDFPRSVMAVNAGAPAWTAITHLRFALVDKGLGAPSTLHISAVEAIPDLPTLTGGAAVFYFADTTGDAYTMARPKLDAVGGCGVIFPIAANMGAGAYTIAQAQALHARGWDVGVHAMGNADHAEVNAGRTEAYLRARFATMQEWAFVNGFDPNLHLWSGPTPGSDDMSDQISRDYFSMSIGGQGLQSPHNPVTTRWKRIVLVPSVSLATATGWVDKAKASNAVAIFALHQLTDGTPTGTQWSRADFDALVDYVKAQAVPIRTLTDIIGRIPHV